MGHDGDTGLPAGASSVARRGPRPIPLLTKLLAACGASGHSPSGWNGTPEDTAMTPADWLHVTVTDEACWCGGGPSWIGGLQFNSSQEKTVGSIGWS